MVAGASSWRRWSPLSCPARPSDATEAAVRFTRLVGPAFRPPGHAQAHLRTRHSQHPATRIHLVCGPSRSFLGAKKSAGRFHWVMGSFWRGGRGGVGGELKALFGGTGGPGAEQGGRGVDVLVYGLSFLGVWVRSSRSGRTCGTRRGLRILGAAPLLSAISWWLEAGGSERAQCQCPESGGRRRASGLCPTPSVHSPLTEKPLSDGVTDHFGNS